MDNKERRTESNMPGIHEGTQREKGGREEMEADPSLEGVNDREREGAGEIEIVGG